MYDYEKIEKKWQKHWLDNKTFKTEDNSSKQKYYYLVEFPYPSGAGLHVGHVRSYTALDAMARKKRMLGYNVLFPMGWDAFGAPAEQYAIKNHIHPSEAVKENIKTFKAQIQNLGISFDWDREINTTDPLYYKWTQWQFLKFYEHGMAYKTKQNINWCPKCKTGLSNEDSSGGVCERCGSKVIQKEKEQWMLKMSDYSQKLLDGLEETEFLDRIKTAQKNWIGRSDGAEVKFKLTNNEELKVYTTRPDTIFGVTFMVIAPEHPIIEKNKNIIINYDKLETYKKQAQEKTEFERTELAKEKTGVMIEGIKAINPLTNKEIPIFVSDYVMMNYGTGAIMAVPAHDSRDYEFATKYNIPIIKVLESDHDDQDKAMESDGIHINSEFLNGLNKEDAIKKIIKYLEEKNIGNAKTNYKMRDWIFSRQRFWGEPIPMIYCEECGWQPMNEKDLPLTLPEVAEYDVTDDGESPLSKISEWVNTTCPKCGKKARRETDTMPNWAGSSWYYLRYMDPHNDDAFASLDKMKYFGMVDYYNGGMEHATRHLLYARFWHRFLYDIGLVPFKEPFKKRVAHGMILGSNGEKMSKSKGNVVNPDMMVKKYGCDALRCYEMFIGDYASDAAWNEQGLNGCKRFLDRVYKIKDKLNNSDSYTKSIEIKINQTIKKVSLDIDNMKYNTAVSSLMILLNEMEKLDTISKKDYRTFLHLLNPICPHITEELNEICKLGDELAYSSWPIYDENKIHETTKNIGVQINGKIRASITVDDNMSEDEIKNIALSNINVKKYTDNKTIQKIIIIKNKIVSIVVK